MGIKVKCIPYLNFFNGFEYDPTALCAMAEEGCRERIKCAVRGVNKRPQLKRADF